VDTGFKWNHVLGYGALFFYFLLQGGGGGGVFVGNINTLGVVCVFFFL